MSILALPIQHLSHSILYCKTSAGLCSEHSFLHDLLFAAIPDSFAEMLPYTPNVLTQYFDPDDHTAQIVFYNEKFMFPFDEEHDIEQFMEVECPVVDPQKAYSGYILYHDASKQAYVYDEQGGQVMVEYNEQNRQFLRKTNKGMYCFIAIKEIITFGNPNRMCGKHFHALRKLLDRVYSSNSQFTLSPCERLELLKEYVAFFIQSSHPGHEHAVFLT